MPVPEALRKQIEAVDEFVKNAPPVNPPANVLSIKSDPADKIDDEPQAPVGDLPPADSPPAHEPSPRTQEEWTRLTGKVQALQREINAQNDTIAKLTQELVQLKSRPHAPPVQAPAPAASGAEFSIDLPEDAADVFGAEGADILRAVATNAARAAIESVQPQVARTAADMYEAAVVAAVPDIDAINESSEFQSWLVTPDPLTGVKPQDLFNAAGQSLNSGECIRLYNHFKQKVAPASARAPSQPPSASKPPLTDRVSPGAKPTEGPTGQTKPNYTLAQYKEVQARLTHQRSRLTPDQYRELRSTFEDMQKALNEGRIIG